jgi:hypothetical protein
MIIVFGIILILPMSILFFSFIISLFSGTFILYNQIRNPNKKIKIDGSIKINLLCHILYLTFLIISPIILINKKYLLGFVIYYCINIFLGIISYKLAKTQMLNIEEIICFLNIPAIIKFKRNRIINILRPFSNKLIKILLLSSLLIIIFSLIIFNIINGI